MDIRKSFSILIITLVLTALIPVGICGEENSTALADAENITATENETPVIVVNATLAIEPVNASDPGNSSGETPPMEQNQSVTTSEAAIEKAFTGWYDQGMKALAGGNYQSASEAFAAALRLEKGSEKAQIGYARALSELGRDTEALVIYSQVRNSSPNNTEILIPLGREQNEAGNYTGALTTLLNATALFPENTEGWNQLAAAYAGQSRFEEALTTVRRSLQISLNQSEGWGQLGAILSGQGRFYEAIPAFEKSVTLDPGNAQSWTGLGDTWTALNRYDEAVTTYRTATDLRPGKNETWIKIAQVYDKQGKIPEATEAYEKGGVITRTVNETSPTITPEQTQNQTTVEQANTTGNITEEAIPNTTSSE